MRNKVDLAKGCRQDVILTMLQTRSHYPIADIITSAAEICAFIENRDGIALTSMAHPVRRGRKPKGLRLSRLNPKSIVKGTVEIKRKYTKRKGVKYGRPKAR